MQREKAISKIREHRSNENVVSLSGVLYYDMDGSDYRMPVEELRRQILQKHSNKISMLGTSVGGSGLFMYVNVGKELNKFNFNQVYEHFKWKVFNDITFCNNAKGISRPHFLPVDENLFFENKVIGIPEDINNEMWKNNVHIVKPIKVNNIHCFSNLLPMSEILPTLVTETPVYTGDSDFIVEEIPKVKLYIQNKIPDGKKHTMFRTYINILVHLNPGITDYELLSFMNYINLHRTEGSPMQHKQLISVVKHAAKVSRIEGLWNEDWVKVRKVHVSKTKGFTRKQKQKIANVQNGEIRRKGTFEKIGAAICTLKETGQEINVKNVFNALLFDKRIAL